MKKYLMCLSMGCILFSASALADMTLSEWLENQAYRGNQIEVIRVESEKPLVVTEETDPEIASILKEAEILDEDADDRENAAPTADNPTTLR